MQTPNNNPQREDETLQAPPRLVSALKCLQRERLFIPPALDEAVLRAAQRHLAREEKPRLFRLLRLTPWLAATAALVILLVVVVPHPFKRAASTASPKSFPAHKDLSHGAPIDILDAFALARQLKAGVVSDPRLDMNGDGVVDERDVAIIAAQAVKLQNGGHS